MRWQRSCCSSIGEKTRFTIGWRATKSWGLKALKSVPDVVERPLFPPLTEGELKKELELTISQSPLNFGIEQSRWRLDSIRTACTALRTYTTMGVLMVLTRMGIRHLRGRNYSHSPDKEYAEKLEYIKRTIKNFDPETQVIYFMDQLTVYLHPSVGYDWSMGTEQQPLARRGYKSDLTFRLCGAINCFTGETEVLVRNKITVPTLVEFLTLLTAKNPGKTVIAVADNWPNHWHPNVRAALQEQLYPFRANLPQSWAQIKPMKKYIGKNLPVQMVHLPTYASWLNPIEKLWRWLKQDLIHQHRLTDDFKLLKQKVIEWVTKEDHQFDKLLKYVGLLADDGSFSDEIKFAKSNFSKNA